MKRFGILFAAFGLLAAPFATAQMSDEGLLNAVAYKPFPEGAPIAVRPLDDSDENLALLRRFEGELRAGGYAVAADAALVLTFEIRDSVGTWSDGGRRTVLELEFKTEAGIGGDKERLRLNLFDNVSGGMLNEGRERGTSIVTPSQYRVDATIDDRRSGQRLWQGWAIAYLREADGATLTRSMVPALVGSFGQTVRRQPFKLP